MSFFKKLSIIGFCISLCLSTKLSASTGYTIEELKDDKIVLKTIAVKIASKEENVEFIKNELRRKHSSKAYELWSNYNPDSLPNVENLKKLNLSRDITLGRPIDSNFRKNNLRPLVGKENFTLLDDETINQIKNYLDKAIENGNISLTINKMLAQNISEADCQFDSLQIEYILSASFAKVYEKEKTSIPTIKLSESKNEIIVIMFAKEFIEALLSNKKALEEQEFQGRIISVYSK